ncbi:MAG: dockerin type I domain-containing protein [Oscillospiraceae bacterium]|nr:dockerin type I domain-containing protein [Oscillospiraceae bacterium]
MSQNPQLRYAEPPDADIRGIFNQTWSCAAFARYAYFYIFGNPWNSYDPMTPPTRTRFIESKSLSDALPGDIIVWGDPHWAVYLGNNLFFHANIGATNMISYGTPYGGGRAPDRIYRAVNYDSINNTTVESYTITYYANGGSGAPESQTKYYLADLLLSDKVPVRSRYTFLGWSTYSTSANATYYRVPNQNIYEHVYTANRSNPMYAVWCKKGDVDRNGAVAIADVLEILKYLAKMDSAIRGVGFLSGDANGDGQVTIADALEILKYLAKMPSSLDN